MHCPSSYGGLSDHPYLMIHNCLLGITADGCNYTEVIAKPCEMMPKREGDRREKPMGERGRDTQTWNDEGRGGNW